MTGLRAALLLLIGAPVSLGAMLTTLAAFGWQPGVGGHVSQAGFAQALAVPGIATSLWLTLATGVGATLIALALSVPVSGWLIGRDWAARGLAPLLAVPHAALALGVAFLLAPSGWIARLIAVPMGWSMPPAWPLPGDPWGAALILGLVLKELPFLLLVTLAAAATRDVAADMAVGRSLGYAPGRVWARLIWPQLYPALRLPLFITLSFALSVVDMALILGPSHPPTLAVQILRLLMAPDLALRVPASALALILLGLIGGVVMLWIGTERAVAALGRRAIRAGRRGRAGPPLAPGIAALGAGLPVLALAGLALWSVAGRWSFPQLWPATLSLTRWARVDWGVGATTLGLGVTVTVLALMLAVAVLETEDRARRRLGLGVLIVLPLLLPQIGFLQGLTSGFLVLGLPPGPLAVIWAEGLFVFPYVLLALAGPWRALDPAQLQAAASLGAGPWRILWRIRLPLMVRPLMSAAAIGFAVSVAQYLAVLLPGAGRVAVLATEAVTLSSGADRRLAAVYGLLLAALPLLGFAAALSVPDWRGRDQRRAGDGA
ncbi:MAG: ABC transporter permease subunit [Paracoccaceae bacterium]|nr:ABC transporter permease subunit [Paracoccaceae bacterium]